MLAVLKAGAAYLAIDPGCRWRGSQFMVTDAAPIAAITTAGLAVAAGRVRGGGHRGRRPRIDTNPAPRCRRRPPRTSPTSSTPRAPPAPRRWPSPPQPDPAGEHWTSAWAAGGQVWTPVPLMPSTLWEIWAALLVAGGWWWCPSRWPVHRMISTPCWSAEQVDVFTQTLAVAALSPQVLESAGVLLGGGEAVRPGRGGGSVGAGW